MAELTFYPEVQQYVEGRPLTFSVLSSSMIVLGFFCTSYPEDKPEWAPWSNAMLKLGHYIFPARAEYARFYPAIGAQLICFGAMFNHTAKRILQTSWPCWLGKNSFAIYLIHAPLIRTLLTYMLWGASSRPPSPGQDKDGRPLPQPWIPMTSKVVAFICIPLFYVLLYRLSTLWVNHVDPFCGRVTNWVEERIFRDDTKVEKQLLQA